MWTRQYKQINKYLYTYAYMAEWLQQIFTHYAQVVPIEILILIASFTEEVIPPIPAFPITILAGNLAEIQGYSLIGLLFLATVGSFGKTIGATLIYYATQKIETFAIEKYGPFFKITEADLTQFGKKFGNGKMDYLILTTLRAIPIIPSALTTVGSAIIHLPITIYIVSTFIGSIIRYSIYLYAGYFSAEVLIIALGKLEESPISLILLIISVIALTGWLLYLYKKRSKNT